MLDGMQARGRAIPAIETVLNMAIELDGVQPGAATLTAPAAPAPPAPPAAPAQIPGLLPRTAPGFGGPTAPVPAPNSARNGDALMADAEFMAGARAILRR